MLKRLISLNLTIIILISMTAMFPRIVYAASGDNGYAVYYKNDGSDDSSSQTVGVFLSSNSSLLLYEAAPKYSGAGKVVVSYNTRPDGSGITYSLTEPIRSTHSTDEAAPARLYAMWADASEPYILYLNTGCTSPVSESYYINDGLSDPALVLGDEVFSDYDGKLIGWSTSIHGYGRSYAPGQSVSVNGSLTLLSKTGINYINYHIKDYDWESGGYIWKSYCRQYQWEEDIYYSHGYSEGKIFTGWNSAMDGNGTWYTETDSVEGAPHDLYAIYEEYPSEDYVVLQCRSGLSSGKMYDFIALTNGETILPSELRNGARAAAWYDGYGTDALYFPCDTPQVISNRTSLTAEVVHEHMYYGLIDGDGGTTPAGSRYYLAQCFVTSAGDLNIYSFNDTISFTKENAALTGYVGRKTRTLYDFNDDIWAAMGDEAESSNIAYFTAQYEDTGLGSILYLGNGQYTSDGKSNVRQDVDFQNINGDNLLSNPFVAPPAKYFLGWNSRADGNGTWYDANSPIAFEQNVVLYAQWGQNRITYHFEDWRGLPTTSTKIDNESFYRSMSYETHREDLFEGWNEQQDGSGAWHLTGENIKGGSVIDLYERWITLPTTGYFYALTSTSLKNGRMAQVITMDSEQEDVILPNLGNLGWYKSGSFNSLKREGFLEDADFYLPGKSVAIQSGTVLSSLNAYIKATYNKNNGGSEQRVYYNLASHSSLQLYTPEDVFGETPSGADFTGWNTERNGSGTTYPAGRYLYDGEYDLYAQWQASNVINNRYTYLSTQQVNPGQTVSVSTSNGAGWYFFVIDCSSTATDLVLYDSGLNELDLIYSHGGNSFGDSKTNRNYESVYGAYLPAAKQYSLNIVGRISASQQRQYNEQAPYTLLTYYAAELPALNVGVVSAFNSLDDSHINWQRRFAVFTPSESGWYRMTTPNENHVYYRITGCVRDSELDADWPVACRAYSSWNYQYLLHAGDSYILEYNASYNNWSYFEGEYGVTRSSEPQIRLISGAGEYPMTSYSNANLSVLQSGIYHIAVNADWNPTLFGSDGLVIAPIESTWGQNNTSLYYRLAEGENYYLYSEGYGWDGTTSEPIMRVSLATVEATIENGVSLSFTPGRKNVQIIASKDWCVDHDVTQLVAALYSNGRMLSCALARFDGNEDVSLTASYIGDIIPELKIFSLDDAAKPVYRALPCELSDYLG